MYYTGKTILFLDNKWVKSTDGKTDLYSQTLHYGAGVFEGIRSYKTDKGTKLFKAKEHFERLHYSAKKMHIKIPYSIDELTSLSYELLKKNNLEDAYIRPLVFLGQNMTLQPSESVHVMLCAWEWGKYLGNSALKIMTSSFQRPNPKSCFIEAKVTGHYINSILATKEAKQKGYDESLLLDMNGCVAEGPGANFFYEKENILYTAPHGNILSGITRQTIFEIAKELKYTIKEKHFKPKDVYAADGAFFTGTAAEISAIESLDNHSFKLTWEETMGYKLALAYQKRVQEKWN